MEGVSKGQAVGIVRDVLVREEFEWVSQQTRTGISTALLPLTDCVFVAVESAEET